MGGSTTANGQATGISLANNAQANLVGSNNTTYLGTGDSLGAYGGGNTINSGANDLVVIGNTNGNYDNVNATNDVTGGSTANGQGTGIALNAGAQVNVNGSNDGIIEYGASDRVNVYATGTTTSTYGSDDLTQVYGANDKTYVNGAGDRTNNYGSSDYTYDYGNKDQTNNYGSNEYAYDYGSQETIYDANSSDSAYEGNSSDFTSGSSFGGYYGYGGYYGFAGDPSTVAATVGSNIGAVAQYDLSHGDNKGATIAERAKSEVEDAIAHDAKVVLSGAKWENNTVTWSVGSGGDFSGSMSPSEVQAVKQAFAEWSTATGLNFKEVASTGTADITVGMGSFDTSNTGVVGFTTFRTKGGEIQPGAVVRVEDVSEDPLVSGADGASVYGGTDATFSQALLHEIGHALGFGDNADPTSVESYYLSAANRTLSSNDIAQAAALYGRGSAAVHDAHQIIQAMSSFAPAPMVSTVAANDPSAFVHAMLYGGSQLMQRANAR
jgi:hypothetical protein